MFQSKRRNVIYPQAEHARLAGTIAAAWRPETVPLPFGSFVRGVALHDRGYGELDNDPIGGTTDVRWAEIQTWGFRMRSGDKVTDLVVAMHIRRLVGARDIPLAREIDEALGEVSAEARQADKLTELCDLASFAFCFERPMSGDGFAYDGNEKITLDPWPLTVPLLRCVVGGFEADGYPERLEPVIGMVQLCPA